MPSPAAAMGMPTEYAAISAKSARADRVDDSRETAFMKGERAATSVGSTTPAGRTLPSAGQLTTGEINDFSKWDRWADINQEDLGQYRSTWQQYADHRYTLQLTTPTGGAVVNAAVELKDGQGNVLWNARTDAQGRAELWAHYFQDVATPANGLVISGSYQGTTFAVKTAKPFSQGINFHTLATPCRDQAVIDMAFVVDATGSMGDEIQYLQAELLDVIRRVQDSLPTADLHMGSVFYRDLNEQYLTLTQPLTADATKAVAFLQEQSASGGGDYPEAVEAALEAAIDSLQWRPEATTRLLFLVLDAPPHQAEENIKRLQVAVTKAARLGIQIVPVSCSGVDKSTEYLLRNMALATNGTYTFITDHSGIGDGHIEPSTDTYEVEFLNDVLVRLTVSRSRLAACERPIAAVTVDPTAVATTATRDWQFFPNPTSGAIQLDFPAAGGLLYLADASGKILQRLATNPQLKMDLTGYPAGTYWLRHEDAAGQWTQGQVLLVGQ
ncbi:MAG: VWA domain-containing protein [Bacteroidetes bacterium]|nr:MAG: VWA domain-containing protein [Bacteroidota bacterium]